MATNTCSVYSPLSPLPSYLPKPQPHKSPPQSLMPPEAALTRTPNPTVTHPTPPPRRAGHPVYPLPTVPPQIALVLPCNPPSTQRNTNKRESSQRLWPGTLPPGARARTNKGCDLSSAIMSMIRPDAVPSSPRPGQGRSKQGTGPQQPPDTQAGVLLLCHCL